MTDEVFIPAAETSRRLRDAMGRFATGVTVVTIATPAGPLGFTANSFASVSLDPPLVLWSPARSSQRFASFAAADQFSIHVLGADQQETALRFVRGGSGFDGLAHAVTPEGPPEIPGALARFDCTRHASHDGGDHQIILGLVHRFTLRDGAPLIFSQGVFGHFLPA